MFMDIWNYFGPSATALRNIYDARAGESTEATESDCDESDSGDTDESATAHPLEAYLSRYLYPGLAVCALSARVASALGELELNPEAPSVFETGLEELASLIDVRSRPSISFYTSSLYGHLL